MRHAKKLIAGALVGAPQHVAARQPRQINPTTVEIVNKIFLELQAIFPAWRQAWPDADALAAAKRSWVRALAAAGINRIEQIRYGLAQCRLSGSSFAPSVGQFIGWCTPTPEALGLPSSRDAYRQATRIAHPTASSDDVHPAVYHAACEVGLYELTQLPELQSWRLFERAYRLTVQMLMAGQPLREVPKGLPEQVRLSTPEVGRRALKNLREMLVS